MDAYSEWIAKNIPTKCRGMCSKATKDMVAAFPELTRVRGHYECLIWGRQPHWWCVTNDGMIVDPTASQFPSSGGEYIPLPADFVDPIGKCWNCGEWVWDECFSGACSEECRADLIRELSQ